MGAHGLKGVGVVGFEGQDIIGPCLNDLLGNVTLCPHGINGHGGSLELQAFQQSRNGFDLVALLLTNQLTGIEVVIIHPSPEQVHQIFAGFGTVGSPQRLAINGYVLASELSTPTGEHLQQGLWGKAHEHIAKHIMRRSSMRQGQEGAKPVQLGPGEVLHVQIAFAITQRAAKSNEQHFIKPMANLASVAMVRKRGKLGPQSLQSARNRELGTHPPLLQQGESRKNHIINKP